MLLLCGLEELGNLGLSRLVAATGLGAVVLAYGTGAPAAVGLAGRAVIVGFPLETIEDPDDLDAVVAALRGFVDP